MRSGIKAHQVVEEENLSIIGRQLTERKILRGSVYGKIVQYAAFL
jgi:hypothetical protein